MRYVSLMGTQSIAVLNPLLSLKENGEAPEGVILLATAQTQKRAESLRDHIVAAGFEKSAIDIQPVSLTLETDAEGRPAAPEVLRELISAHQRIYFNIAGGLNFQIAACVRAVRPEDCVFLYPESEGVHRFEIRDFRLSSETLLSLPPVVDVLTIQNIVHRLDTPKKRHPLMNKALSISGIRRPKNAVSNLVIGEVVFDLAINHGNGMKFIKAIQNIGKEGRSQKRLLAEARKVIRIALNREDFGELYHRDIAVLTADPLIAERIETEGGGKVDVIHLKNLKKNNPLSCLPLKMFLSGVPVAAPRADKTGKSPVETGEATPPALYAPIGTEILTTLIALWSHKPNTTVLFYTPQDPEANRHKESLASAKKILPAKQVHFHPVDITGKGILDLPDPPAGNSAVNITPGTKGHAFFLTLWAMKHGMKIHSIAAKTHQLMEIPEGPARPLQAPAPVSFLKATGVGVISYGEDKERLIQNQDNFKSVLRVLMAIANDPALSISDFPLKRIETRDFVGTPISGKKDQRLRITEKETRQPFYLTIDAKDEWFERLVGFAMAECGAQDVQIRVRTSWRKETENHLKQKFQTGPRPHKTDIDVVARFQTTYYVVSCKSGKNYSMKQTTAEADAVARLFGRFTIPMACFLRHDGPPRKDDNGIYIFGYQTLADAEALKGVIQQAADERRKT